MIFFVSINTFLFLLNLLQIFGEKSLEICAVCVQGRKGAAQDVMRTQRLLTQPGQSGKASCWR